MVRAKEIAVYLGKDLNGSDRDVIKVCSINHYCEGGLVFLKEYSESMLSLISKEEKVTAIVTSEYHGKIRCSYVISNNPRLDFARVLQKFFTTKPISRIAETARIGSNVSFGEEIIIGEYSIIGNNVIIGAGTEIRHHVVIADNTVIGTNCLIKSNTVIGEEGFGFERDEMGVPIRIPHLGRVVIGNNVEIGASVVIARGTLDETLICQGTKIDDEVFIAHNVTLGDNTLVIAEAQISGSSKIGDGCWIGPNSTIINNISIGAKSFVGMGAVVTKSIPDHVVVAGCPAKILRNNE